MDPPSFVSKARTAFHSAAAKAEHFLSDFKPDRTDLDKQSLRNSNQQSGDESLKPEVSCKSQNEPKHMRWRPSPIGTKQDWHERLKNIRIGRKGAEDSDKAESTTMSFPFYDENLYLLSMKNDLEEKGAVISLVDSLKAIDAEKVPSTSVIKQMAIAVEAGKKFKSMKDFMVSSRDSSPVRERASLALSAVKSLMLREKDEKITSEFSDDDNIVSLIHLLFDSEGSFLRRKICLDSDAVTTMPFLPREIHAAPPESLVVKLSEVMGSFKTLRKMALFWCGIVAELRRFWSEEQHVPGIPPDKVLDLKSCLLYQQLQVINCCVSRKRRHIVATESLDSVIREGSTSAEESLDSKDTVSASTILYARLSTGELVLRLGAEHPSDNLTMLETGEPVYSPVTQEGPLLTEDLIKETEELVLRTGSVGAGCSQLLSDMQAFKAANPGCILEDFVRWHSPPDWTETEPADEAKNCDGGDLSIKGQLSRRMQKEGNLWRELWETAKAVPAVKQTPLFDEDLAVDGILNALEDIPPSELFEQLFISLFALGFVIAEPTLSADNNFSKLFYECKDYIIATCHGGFIGKEKIDELCQVYETVETMLLNPEEVLKMMKQQEESSTAPGETKRGFKRLSLNFGSKDKQSRKPASKYQDSEESPGRQQPFSNFFDRKSSLFSKKPPKPESQSPGEKPPQVENDWTIV